MNILEYIAFPTYKEKGIAEEVEQICTKTVLVVKALWNIVRTTLHSDLILSFVNYESYLSSCGLTFI